MPADLRKRSTPTSSEISSAPSSSTTSSTSPTPNNPRSKIDKSSLYDLAQIKRLLDDEVIAFMEDRGYEEAVLVSNIKIIAGTGATIAAVYSHFNPYQFPENRNLVLFCVTFYAICIAAINVSSYLWENSAIFVGKVAPKAKKLPSNASLAPRVWVFSTIGENGHSNYKIALRTTGARDKKTVLDVSHPYETYFTEHGKFLVHVFRAHMNTILETLHAPTKKSS